MSIKSNYIIQEVINTEYTHEEIHDGNAFTAAYKTTTANSNSVRSAILFKTGAKEIHMVASFSCVSAANAGIYEQPTVAANVGTHTNTPINRNRRSPKTSTIISNATVPLADRYTTLTEAQIAGDGTFALGAELRLQPLKTSTGVNALGGESRDSQEYVLNPDTKYLFIIQNTVAAINDQLIILDWYEETV
jgi:hypothetical protein